MESLLLPLGHSVPSSAWTEKWGGWWGEILFIPKHPLEKILEKAKPNAGRQSLSPPTLLSFFAYLWGVGGHISTPQRCWGI